jgi:cytochrome P450
MEFLSRDRLSDPYPDYSSWREHRPIWWAEDVQGWVISRYEDIRAVLKDPKTFSSTSMGEGQDQAMALPLLTDDPPRHTQLRAIVNKAFTSRALKDMEAEVSTLVDEMLDELDAGGPIDISDRFTIPLPVAIISRLMDIPFERKDDFKRWSDALTGTSEASSLEERMPDIMEMAAYFQSLIPERRARPGDDLISKVVHAEMDGESLSDTDIVGFNILLLIAGNETTTNLLSNLLHYLADHPDTWDELRQHPELADAAVEETLRYDAPVHWVSRKATSDTEIQGQSIKAGETVFAVLGSANRDESHYPHADSFRLDREKGADHHTFGHGIHFCIGAPLGRLEARYGLQGLLKRFKSVRHASGAANERTYSNMLRGFHHLWLDFEADHDRLKKAG